MNNINDYTLTIFMSNTGCLVQPTSVSNIRSTSINKLEQGRYKTWTLDWTGLWTGLDWTQNRPCLGCD